MKVDAAGFNPCVVGVSVILAVCGSYHCCFLRQLDTHRSDYLNKVIDGPPPVGYQVPQLFQRASINK